MRLSNWLPLNILFIDRLVTAHLEAVYRPPPPIWNPIFFPILSYIFYPYMTWTPDVKVQTLSWG